MIEWCADRRSVSAREAPYEQVLSELQRQIGVGIEVNGPLAGTLTQEFAVLSLEQALRRLFRDVNQVFFYTPGSKAGTVAERLSRVWLLPKDQNAAQAGTRPPLAPSFGRANPPRAAPTSEAQAKPEGELTFDEEQRDEITSEEDQDEH